MGINLTQKEKMLLQDQANHEKICIQKYNNYANQTQDPQLKQLLLTYAQEEQEHLNTLNQIMGGTVPNIQQPGQQQSQLGQQAQQKDQQTQQVEQKAQQEQQYSQQTQQQIAKAQQQQTQQSQEQQGQQTQEQMGQQQSSSQAGLAGQREKDLLTDLLMTEKYMSDTYDTAIFEFTDSNVRQVLNHIQKEEQQHGEGIFNYMQSHGMYNPQ